MIKDIDPYLRGVALIVGIIMILSIAGSAVESYFKSKPRKFVCRGELVIKQDGAYECRPSK